MSKQVKKQSEHKDLVVEVLRDDTGKLYSQIRDRAYVPKSPWATKSVVIDRQKGRGMDQDSVINRAQAMAELTGLPYDEDLSWPCRAKQGFTDCACPECAERINNRAKGKQK